MRDQIYCEEFGMTDKERCKEVYEKFMCCFTCDSRGKITGFGCCCDEDHSEFYDLSRLRGVTVFGHAGYDGRYHYYVQCPRKWFKKGGWSD